MNRLNYNGLSYSFDYNTGDSTKLNNMNSYLVMFASFFTLGLIFLGTWIYQQETPAIVFGFGSTFTPLGGWLIIIAVLLIFTAVFSGSMLLASDYFSLATWNLNAANNQSISFRFFIIYEVTGFIGLMCLSIYCLILLVKKRDILPKVITVFFLFTAGFF